MFLLVSVRYDSKEETNTTEDESMEGDGTDTDSDEETKETK